MNELTLQQTDIIARFVKSREIVFSHLCDDLTDHICCETEEEMQKGVCFDEALHIVKQRIGENGLREIQEETLYAVESKYRKMKRAMKISSVAGTVMIGLASIFKITHLPMAGAMFTLGALIIIFGFLPSSLMVLWKESKSGKRLFLFISAFIASSLYIAGIIFKIQHWPGAPVLFSAGILSAVFIFIPLAINNMLRNADRIVPVWTIILGGISFIFFGTGYLMKLMLWPGASVILTAGTGMLTIIVIPAFIWHRWKKETYITAGAIVTIAASLIFLVPPAVLNFSPVRDFENMFYATSELENRSLEFRKSRNETLLLAAGATERPELDNLHSETLSLIALIDKTVETAFDPTVSPVTELRNKLELYKGMLSDLNEGLSDPGILPALDLNRYLPPTQQPGKEHPHPELAAVRQSMNLLKGYLLDAEAATIRNLTVMDASVKAQE